MTNVYSTGIAVTAQLCEGNSLPLSIAESSIRIVFREDDSPEWHPSPHPFPGVVRLLITERVRSVKIHRKRLDLFIFASVTVRYPSLVGTKDHESTEIRPKCGYPPKRWNCSRNFLPTPAAALSTPAAGRLPRTSHSISPPRNSDRPPGQLGSDARRAEQCRERPGDADYLECRRVLSCRSSPSPDFRGGTDRATAIGSARYPRRTNGVRSRRPGTDIL